MDILALPTRYDAGKASVDAGGLTVTPLDAAWYRSVWGDDLFFLPSQPMVPPQRIASANADGTLTLAYPWPGTAAVEEVYEIRFVGIIERSTEQSRKVLEQLGDVKAWYDIIVEDDAARLALESASNPLRSGYRVLVRLDGVIWMKETSAFGDWIGPVEFKGDKGDKGWSPVYASVVDGERRVEQLVAWVGGEGPAPAGVGKYRGAAGLVDTAAEATDIRGPAGNITGVTPFWQGRITVDVDAAAAREGLGLSSYLSIGPAGNMNDVRPYGFYYAPPGATNLPPGETEGWFYNFPFSTTYAAQEFIGTSTGNHWRRQLIGGVYSAWRSERDASQLTIGTLANARIADTLTPDKAFRRGNILGTVSQIAGVPTGALIERGSNANGRYAKFADGTLLCWVAPVIYLDTNLYQAVTLPAAFADATYSVSRSFSTTASSGVTGTWNTWKPFIAFDNLNANQLGGLYSNTVQSVAGVVYCLVSGRWF